MRVCFYLDNKRKSDIDFSKPKNGNPGIGGTEYMIWTISAYLDNIYEDLEVNVLAPEIKMLPTETINKKCDDIYEAVKTSKEIGADILVLRGGKDIEEKLYALIDNLKVNTIMWCHNFEEYDYLKLASKSKYVKANVCVSKQQYHRLRDHSVFKKSRSIYNALDFSLYNNDNSVENNENIICYLGAIRPFKGFHKVAEFWPQIEKRIPNAKLYVIGSGKLYDKSIKLGKYGIAEETYENQFIKYLINEKSEIKGNIKFFGDLAHNEKIDVMKKSKIGIVNPVAKDETFCISAIEFEALGIPVVARKTYGLLDTVDDKRTGILAKNESEFVDAIDSIIKNEKMLMYMGNNGKKFVRNKFDIREICNEWYSLFNDIVDNKNLDIDLRADRYFSDYKFLREINRNIKKMVFMKKLPAILEYPNVIYDMKIYKFASSIKDKCIGKH